MGKLKYGLKKTIQKETQRIVSFDVSYDHEDDELYVGMSVRKDAYDPKLLDRVKTAINIALQLVADDPDEGTYNGSSPELSKAAKDLEKLMKKTIQFD